MPINFFLTINAVIGIALMTIFLLCRERKLVLQKRQDSVQSAVDTASAMLGYYDARAGNNECRMKKHNSTPRIGVAKSDITEVNIFGLMT